MSDDRGAIIDVINRYGLAMDSQTWDLFETIFAGDVEAIYPSAHWTDLPSFKRDFAKAHAHVTATQHMMMNHQVAVDGDSATSFTYCAFRLLRRGTPGGDFMEGSAWYDDAWTRSPSGWLITRRACRILWSDGNAMVTRPNGGTADLPEWNSLIDEAAKGQVGYLQALLGR